MSSSSVDKRIKNARIAVSRARNREHRARAEKELNKALTRKAETKALRQ